MKRDGYIIEEIVERNNLEESFDTVVRGNKRKATKEGQWLWEHREAFLNEVAAELSHGTITLSKPINREVVEHGKIRHIQIFDMKSRIKVNAVMSVVDKHLRGRFIRTTSASIKGRGMHELKAYIERDMREDPAIRYWYKFDIKKFYDTVHQDFIMFCVNRTFKDKRLISIIEILVHLLPDGTGMSMGLRASQGLCNLLLSVFLDHYLKDRYQVRHFYRYCDDGVIGGSSKQILWLCRNIVHEQIEVIGQEIKKNERVFPISEGLDFLGYVVYPTHSQLRKRVKQDFARKLARVRSRKRRKELVGSLWGLAKHCNSWHLLETILYPSEYNMLKRKAKKRLNMKDFGSVKVEQKEIDGKKNFRGQKISGRELDHKSFIIYDYEKDVIPRREKEEYEKRLEAAAMKGIDTNLVDKPKAKYIVSIIYQGQLRKMWTGDKEMWNDLNSAAEQGCLPMFCSMDVDYSGAFPKYSLVSGTAFGFQMPTDEELEAMKLKLKLK